MSYDLNGTTQYITIPSAILPLNEGTFSFWAAPDLAANSSGAEWFLHGATSVGHYVYKTTTANRFQLYFDGRTVDLTVTYTTSVLTHFLVRYRKSDNTLELWVSGTQCAVAAGPAGTWGSTALGASVFLGSDVSAGRKLDGDIAEYATWNVLLSTGQIGLLAAGASPCVIASESIVGYLPLKTDAVALRGSNNGTLVGSPSTSLNPVVAPCNPRINIGGLMLRVTPPISSATRSSVR